MTSTERLALHEPEPDGPEQAHGASHGASQPRHEIVLGTGLLERLGDLLLGTLEPGPCVLVTDPGVRATGLPERAVRGLRSGGFEPLVLEVPAGESGKTLASATQLWRQLGEAGLERRAPIVALGGGGVGDVAGFCASTWKRGVPLVQVPTTLLAMADSAIGGKTGVNLDGTKNVVGTLHLAELVVADLDTLGSLPERELRSGLAEVVKCAVLCGAAELEGLRRASESLLARDVEALRDAVRLAVRVKLDHVRDDLHDLRGPRALLNLGHTTAHALEAATGLGGLRHGEAVAIGLVVAARVAVGRGLYVEHELGRLRAVLLAVELPVRVPQGLSTADLVTHARSDKKRRAGEHRMVLPLTGGGARTAVVAETELAAAIDATR